MNKAGRTTFGSWQSRLFSADLSGRTHIAVSAAGLVALLAFVVLTAIASSGASSLWVADHKALKRLDPASNTFVQRVALAHEVDAVAVDPANGIAWALSDKHLLKLSAAGALQADIDVKKLGSNFPDPKLLALDPRDGTLWVAGEKGWMHLSSVGQFLAQGKTADDIQAIGLDAAGNPWVLTQKQLLRFTPQGVPNRSLALPAPGNFNRLAVDSLGGYLWLAGGNTLLRFDSPNLNQPPLAKTLPNSEKVETILTHPLDGTLWVATKTALRVYDQSGLLEKQTALSGLDLGDLVRLAFEPRSNSLWLAGKKALARFSVNGDYVARLLAEQQFDAIGVEPFELRPAITILNPTDGSRTSNARPTLKLELDAECNGTPCDLVDSYFAGINLAATLNNQPIGSLFSRQGPALTYTPSARLPEGANVLTAHATDAFGQESDEATSRFTIDTIAPAFVALSPADNSTVSGAQVTIQGQLDDPTGSVTLKNAAGTVLNHGGANFSFAVTLQSGLNGFTLTATDPAGNSTTVPLRLTLNNAPPAPVPSVLNPTRFTPFAEATAFLYTGANPVQTGVNAALLDPNRVAVLRGRVLNRDGSALVSVKVTVVGHPESGQTLSRADGVYDLVANGGGIVTVRFEKSGYMPAQRNIRARWLNYGVLPDVIMLPYDAQVTTVDLTAPIPMQVARGSRVTDADGARQATVFFPQGTTATLVKPDGSTQAISRLDVRATEYTVGPDGPKAMPATLPPTSGYTYAVELSADEAIAAGAKTVRFSQPVMLYVENFLNFPVGGLVPVGVYDFDRVAWIPSDNGRVIKILSISGGLAVLDTDGDGVADSPTQLAARGITTAEQAQLASLYSAGQSLWRMSTMHFSPWDGNFPVVLPPGAGPPPGPGPGPGDGAGPGGGGGPGPGGGGDGGPGPGGGDGDSGGGSDGPGPGGDAGPGPGPDRRCGSVIECQNQVLGETVKLTGTPFNLIYRSNRVIGATGPTTLRIPLSTDVIPTGLKRIELFVSVAGVTTSQSFPPAPNQTYAFNWNGKDVFGRDLQGSQPATIHLAYVYDGFYSVPPQWTPNFGAPLGVPLAIPIRAEGGLSRTYSKQVFARNTPPDGRVLGLGGWTLDMHHSYDSQARILYQGDGRRRGAYNLSAIVETVTSAGGPTGVAVDAAGNIFYVNSSNNKIIKLGIDGVRTTVAGNGTQGFSGDGGPATAAALNAPQDIAIDRWGNLYIADSNNHRVRKVGLDGTISTIAGNGAGTYSGDNGLATNASLRSPLGVAVDAEGSVFIADTLNHRIRRIDPAGFINTVAGSGAKAFGGDGGPAMQAALDTPYDVAVDDQGNMFIADFGNRRVRKVMASGIISTFAGNGDTCCIGSGGDGGPAIAASLGYPVSVAVDPQSNVYIALSDRVRRVSPTGRIVTTAGGSGGESCAGAGDGGPSRWVALGYLGGVAVDPQGDLIVTDYGCRKVRKITPAFPGSSRYNIVVPSEDGNELYEFDPAGRHLRTLNALTGATRYSFTYNTNGYLTQVQDGDGNTTTIERNPGDTPAAIIAPDGQRTVLALDGNGYLASIANPAGETTRMVYTPGGLMTSFTNPRGFASTMTYDSSNRLIREDNAAGGSWRLERVDSDGEYYVSLQSALGRGTLYRVVVPPTGGQIRINTYGDQTKEIRTLTTSGDSETVSPDGTRTSLSQGSDPRFGMMAPFTESSVVETPSGLRSATYAFRTVTPTDPNVLFNQAVITDEIFRNGEITTRVYDASSRQTTATSPLGRQYLSVTDTQGRPTIKQAAGLEPIAHGYDGRGRLISLAQGSGADQRRASFSYNPAGYVQSITDAQGRSEQYNYDTAGRLTRRTLPDGRAIGYSYDANGNVTSVTPPGRPLHTFAYTPVDLEERYLPPAVADATNPTTQYAYNVDKQLTAIARPDGQSVSLIYDYSGRLTTVSYPSGSTTRSYNATTGKLANLTTGDGQSLAYTYDGFLLTGEQMSGAVNGTVVRGYDDNFRPTSLGVNGTTIPFGYDADGLLVQAGSLALTRNAQNGLVTAGSLGAVATTNGHNGFGEIQTLSATVSGTNLYQIQLTRNAVGNITGKSETIQGKTDSYTYGYDDASRLVSVTKNGVQVTSYSYDSNGNRTSLVTPLANLTGTYDDQDRMLSYGVNIYNYTANGELTTKTDTATGQTTTYQYDAIGNLRTVSLPNGNNIEYVIDGRNRRVGKKVNGGLTQGFLYQDQLKPVAELDSTGSIVSLFIYGDRISVPSYMVKGGITYRIVSDYLGSPRLVVNSATGAVVQRMDYDEFGNVLLDTNPGFQPFGFAGGLYDRDIKLTRFGARDYDAETGRWTGKDPILFRSTDTNVFQYALGDPVNWTDGRGLAPSWVGWTGYIVGGVGGLVALAGGPVLVTVGGLGLVVIGGALAIWDLTTPVEQINDAIERMEPIEENMEKLRELLEKREKEVRLEVCPRA